ncbi:MAG: hypothetical protein H6715_03305 [Myxococcales bacterium]|nr:hypothetical protein [Myxococcales bacterium]
MSAFPVDKLIPHRPPILFLDRVLEVGEEFIVCLVHVAPEMAFVNDERMESLVAFEFMAQSAAAYAGAKAAGVQQGHTAGYLISVRDLSLATGSFSVGDVLVVRAHHLWTDKGFSQFQCRVTREGEPLAEGQIGVYQPADESHDDSKYDLVSREAGSQ